MFCGKCGKQLEDDEVVCPWCGEATGVEVGEKRYSQQPENGGYGRNTEERSYVNREPVKPMALLGISVGLAAMMIYFSGLISNTILVVAAGYVLLKEEDRWLRAVAAKAILIVCIFWRNSGRNYNGGKWNFRIQLSDNDGGCRPSGSDGSTGSLQFPELRMSDRQRSGSSDSRNPGISL